MPKKKKGEGQRTGSQDRESSSSSEEERQQASRRDTVTSRTRGDSESEVSGVSAAARGRGISAAASAVSETGAKLSEFARSGLRRFQRTGATAEERRRARISLIGEMAGVYSEEAQRFATGLAATPAEAIERRRNWLIIEALANAIEEQGLDLEQVRGMVGPLRGMIQREMQARHEEDLLRAGVTRGRQDRGESVVSQLPEALGAINEAAEDADGTSRHVLGLLAQRMAQRVRAMAPTTRPTMPTAESVRKGAGALAEKAKAAFRRPSAKVDEVGEIGAPTDVRRVDTATEHGGNPLGPLVRRSEVPGGGTHPGTIAGGGLTKGAEKARKIQAAKDALKKSSARESSSGGEDGSLQLSREQLGEPKRKVSFAPPPPTTSRPAATRTPPATPPRKSSVGQPPAPPPSRPVTGGAPRPGFLGDINEAAKSRLRRPSTVKDSSAPFIPRPEPTTVRQRSGTVARQIAAEARGNPELAAKLAKRNQDVPVPEPRSAVKPPLVPQRTAAQLQAERLGARTETIEDRLKREKAERDAKAAVKGETPLEKFKREQEEKKKGPGDKKW